MTVTKSIITREPVQDQTLNWSLEDVELQAPGDDEVLVEMRASGICHTDIVMSSVPDGVMGIKYPRIVGHEGAGIVRIAGRNVQSVQVGDPVLLSFYSCSSCSQCQSSHPAYCDAFAKENYVGHQRLNTVLPNGEQLWSGFFGQSSFAQHSIVRKASLVNARELLHEDELKLFAALGCGFQTGMGAIQNTTAAMPADIVMVIGLGAVGMGALMTAKIRNCKAIIAVDRIKARLDLAKTLGATHKLDTSRPDFTTLHDAARELFPGGVSIVIETTGVPSLIEQGLQATYSRGKLVMIGIPPLGYNLGINAIKHINSGRSILGCIEGDCMPTRAIPQMIQWHREGRFPIDKLVQYFDATEYQQALDGLKNGTVIKPVLLWNKQS